MLRNNYQLCKLIVLYHFFGRSPTSFTRLFLAGRRAQAGHETTSFIFQALLGMKLVTHTCVIGLCTLSITCRVMSQMWPCCRHSLPPSLLGQKCLGSRLLSTCPPRQVVLEARQVMLKHPHWGWLSLACETMLLALV